MFNLELETDNAAFMDGRSAEIARILRTIARNIEIISQRGDAAGVVLDINGNKVGRWELS